MTITQTVEVPASRRITIEVPREIPPGATIITFTPATLEATAASSSIKRKMTEAEELELINRNAESLNKEAMDALSYQDIDGFEEDFERLTAQDIAIIRGTTVPINIADIVFDRDDERLNLPSGKARPE